MPTVRPPTVPAADIEVGQRIRVAGRVHAVRANTGAIVDTPIGGRREMVLLELSDDTRYDVPPGMDVELARSVRA